jgi:DNA-binding transcriptional ArsR family regulator
MDDSAATPGGEREDELTEKLLSALGHRLRRDVLRSLIEAGTPMSPKELAAYHRVTLGVMSHRIKTLVRVEVVTLVEVRPAGATVQHFYEPGPACSRPLVLDAIGVDSAPWIAPLSGSLSALRDVDRKMPLRISHPTCLVLATNGD